MKAYCLASSSAGNCYILEFDIKGVPTRIMVECGIPLSAIYKKLSEYGLELSDIQICIITHAHGDHCCAARDLNKRGIKIAASAETLAAIGINGLVLEKEAPQRLIEGLFAYPFEVEHDIPGAFGYIFKTHLETVLFVNDHKRWTIDLINFKPNYVFIECNYDHKVVYAQLSELKRMKNYSMLSKDEMREVNIKIKQHERNLNSHCSLNGTIKGLQKLNLKNCVSIFLMHLSDRYANEYRMKNEVQSQTKVITFICGKGGGIK